jgi:hypothetical protein
MIEQPGDLESRGSSSPLPPQRRKRSARIASIRAIAHGALSGAVTGAGYLLCMGVLLTGVSGAALALSGYGAIVGGFTGLLGGPTLGIVRWAGLGACVMTGVTLSLAVLLLEPDSFSRLVGPNTIFNLLVSGVCIGVWAKVGWEKGHPG